MNPPCTEEVSWPSAAALSPAKSQLASIGVSTALGVNHRLVPNSCARAIKATG